MSGRDQLASELQHRVMAFVRAFGLHQPDETPCGARVSVSEAHALTVLAEAGAISQVELGKHLGLTKSTVSRLVDQLTERGWATRHPGDNDARQRLVELTSQGRATADQVAQLRAERMVRLLDRIPRADRAAVLAALDALVEAAREP
jgi:DNA-binding MarR family transcriptional regulator